MTVINNKHYFSEDNEETKTLYVKNMKIFEQDMQERGFPVYLIYGTLLGALREKDFIPHDTDIDLAYLSYCTTKEEVYKERQMLTDYFRRTEHLLREKTIGFKLKYGQTEIDLWSSWVEQGMIYVLPNNRYTVDIVLPLKYVEFRKEQFMIPAKSEDLLDITFYDWKRPIVNNFRKPHGYRI